MCRPTLLANHKLSGRAAAQKVIGHNFSRRRPRRQTHKSNLARDMPPASAMEFGPSAITPRSSAPSEPEAWVDGALTWFALLLLEVEPMVGCRYLFLWICEGGPGLRSAKCENSQVPQRAGGGCCGAARG